MDESRASEPPLGHSVPRIDLHIEMDPIQSANLSIPITVRLQRASDDGDSRPCIIYWTPTVHGFPRSGGGFKLFQRRDDGSDGAEIPIDHSGSVPLPEESPPLIVTGLAMFLWQLAPGQETRFSCSLPERYRRVLDRGCSYNLVWPGGEVLQWDWGTIPEHMDQELQIRSPGSDSATPRLMLRAGQENRASFEAVRWAPTSNVPGWRLRKQQMERTRATSPQPINPAEREPGAPLLRVSLECPPTITIGARFAATINVTYEAEPASDTMQAAAKPIIFHNVAFWGLGDSYRLYRLESRTEAADPSSWKCCSFDDDTGYIIVDEPDITVRPVRHRDFTVLEPGGTWTITRFVQDPPWEQIPTDSRRGDVFRFCFKGATIDWWDWGGAEEHADTTVKLPCFVFGEVTDPSDNGGRPGLVVAASNDAEFTVA